MPYEKALAALADPTRRRLLEELSVAPRGVSEIAKNFPVTQPAISQHLRALLEAGLVDVTRSGTRRIYSARPEVLGELRDYLDEIWSATLAQCGEVYDE